MPVPEPPVEALSYRIKAEADIVAGEKFKANNKYIGGTVKVSIPADTIAPDAPNLTTTGWTDTIVRLSWNIPSGDPAGYKLYRDGDLIWAGWCGSTVPVYTDTGLSPATTYTYTVSAYDAAGNESDQSNTQQVTTIP